MTNNLKVNTEANKSPQGSTSLIIKDLRVNIIVMLATVAKAKVDAKNFRV